MTSSRSAARSKGGKEWMPLYSNIWGTVFAKVAMPLFCGLWVYGICANNFLTWRMLYASPFALVLAFYASLAVVRVRDSELRYRRFISWTAVSAAEVVSSGVTWFPAVGYLRMKQFVPPWGALYFVVYDSPVQVGRTKRRHVLGAFGNPAGGHHVTPATTESVGRLPRVTGRHAVAFVAGNVLMFGHVAIYSRIGTRVMFVPPWSITNRTDVAAAITIACVICLVLLYRHPRAWLLSFFSGAGLARIVVNLFWR